MTRLFYQTNNKDRATDNATRRMRVVYENGCVIRDKGIYVVCFKFVLSNIRKNTDPLFLAQSTPSQRDETCL